MQFLLDHIGAGLIAMGVFLLLVTMQMRGQEASLEAIRHYSAKKHTLTLVEILQHDFQSMYATTSSGPSILSSSAGHIDFMTQDTSGVLHRVRYERIPPPEDGAGTSTIKRFVYGKDDTLRMPGIVIFKISLMDRKGEELQGTYDQAEIFQVGVNLAMQSAFGAGEYIKLSHWASTFRPVRRIA